MTKARSTGILVFSGHGYEDIDSDLKRAEGCIDAVITEPFLIAHRQTLALRGSDNQRLHFLTDLGRERFASYERLRIDTDNQLDLMMDEDGSAYLAGIPKRRDLVKLKSLLLEQGHTCRVSERTLVRVALRGFKRRLRP
jgi:anaerobic ribonucleoside-triphosphate reductase activating protein